ncbi:MAG: DUF6090 family protein [Cyclobacteriaceae bacterium]
MLKLFRKTRRQLLGDSKFGRYLLYATGEIFLVVVGILIAVQINNWNESRKRDIQRVIYELSLINELNKDVINLKRLDSLSILKKERIKNYLDYFNSENPDLQILHNKLDSVISSKTAFYSGAYTIDDLITTGNLSLFSKEKKEAILKLKNTQDRYAYYEAQSIQDVALYEQEIKKNFDLVNLAGLSEKEHLGVAGWKQQPNSHQFLILNNSLAEGYKLFTFQGEMYETILGATSDLLKILDNK